MSHIRRFGLWRRGAIYQYRVRIPVDLQQVMGGATHINRSLRTASPTVAARLVKTMAYEIERQFGALRTGDEIAEIAAPGSWIEAKPTLPAGGHFRQSSVQPSASIGEVCNRYLSDPTIRRTRKSLGIYKSTCAAIVSIVGPDTPIAAISRETCRDILGVLKDLPPGASKRWPDLSAREAVAKALSEGIPAMSPANVNCYLNKLSTVFNWAIKEEIVGRNPARGLRMIEELSARDKREPFSTIQLQRMFDAPLYRGCKDDGYGFAIAGPEKPKRARFWIPLIALFGGMRQNEICQLLTADVCEFDKVICFSVCAGDTGEKSLKTQASQRLVPVHPVLVRIGFLRYLAERRRAGDARLFPDLKRDGFGRYAGKFSTWFSRFLMTSNAKTERTCFHSFRHCFRDALREAQIDREVALTLGGWTATPGSGSNSVADQYGKGYSAKLLHAAISRIAYPDLDLGHLYEQNE